MANLCDTCYKCVGDLEEIKALHNILDDMACSDELNNMWLGNLVKRLDEDFDGCGCRGTIDDFGLSGHNDEVLTIDQTTAWCEQEKVRYAIEKAFPSITVYYLQQELGCGVFSTNDSSGICFTEKYLIDTGDDWEYFRDIEEAAKYAEEIVGHKVDRTAQSITDALDTYMEEHEDEDLFCGFYEISINQ